MITTVLARNLSWQLFHAVDLIRIFFANLSL